jgi:hypothetical protein
MSCIHPEFSKKGIESGLEAYILTFLWSHICITHKVSNSKKKVNDKSLH